ncbi:MAG: TolC family protein [Pseudomonadota bacterium]
MSSFLTCLRQVGCIGVLTASSIGIAHAAAAPLELREAIQAALAHNPDLTNFQFELRAHDAQRQQADLRPAPELGFALENFGGSGEVKALHGSEATLSLSQVIELGGKRKARLAVTDAGRDHLVIARQAAQLDVLAEVTRRFIAVAELQERRELARRAVALAEETQRSAMQRVAAARSPHVEQDRAAVALEHARLDARAVDGRLVAARRTLAAMWGAPDAQLDDSATEAVHADLFHLPVVDDFPVLLQRLEQNPDFLRYASAERLREAELRLASTTRRADISLGAGIRRLQQGGDMALVASFSIPLFSGRRADAFVAEAAARREAVGADRDAALIKARAQLYALYRELQEAAATVTSLDTAILPRMDEVLEETRYAFERGRYGYLDLVDAQREYLEMQRERIAAGTQVQLLVTEIERLTNAPLANPN